MHARIHDAQLWAPTIDIYTHACASSCTHAKPCHSSYYNLREAAVPATWALAWWRDERLCWHGKRHSRPTHAYPVITQGSMSMVACRTTSSPHLAERRLRAAVDWLPSSSSRILIAVLQRWVRNHFAKKSTPIVYRDHRREVLTDCLSVWSLFVQQQVIQPVTTWTISEERRSAEVIREIALHKGIFNMALMSVWLFIQDQCAFNGAWGGGNRHPTAFYVSSYFWDRATDAGIITDENALTWDLKPSDLVAAANKACDSAVSELSAAFPNVRPLIFTRTSASGFKLLYSLLRRVSWHVLTICGFQCPSFIAASHTGGGHSLAMQIASLHNPCLVFRIDKLLPVPLLTCKELNCNNMTRNRYVGDNGHYHELTPMRTVMGQDMRLYSRCKLFWLMGAR